MSCFSVATSRRDVHLITVGYERALAGLHIERARLERDRGLRSTLVKIARAANRRMIAAKKAVRS